MMRKLGLALLLVLADASLLRAQSRPSEFYFLPVVAHTEGDRGSFFVSDLSIVNPQSDSIVVTAYVLPGGADNTNYQATGKAFTLAAHASIFLPDVLREQWNVQGLATLVLAATGGTSADRRFIANSRTYNNANAAGTFGLAVAPTFTETPTGSKAMLAGLANNTGYRSNIGVFNDSAAQASATIEIFDATGVSLGSTAVNLAPYSLSQTSVQGFAAKFDSGYAVVTPTGVAGMSLVAYAAVADNGTSDSTYFEAVPLVTSTGSASATLARIPGALERTLAASGLVKASEGSR
jgi:hypothetical protein